MEKRFLLAIGLSFLVLMAYSSILPKKQPIENKYVANTETPVLAPVAEPIPSAQINPKLFDSKELCNLSSDCLTIKFSKIGGYIVEVFDKTHDTALAINNIGFVKEWSQYAFKTTEISQGVVFDFHTAEGYDIRKTFLLKANNSIELKIEFLNITSSKIKPYDVFVGYFNSANGADQVSQRYYEASLLLNGVVFRKPVHGLKKSIDYSGRVTWLGLRDRYFCSIFLPQQSLNKAVIDIFETGTAFILNIPERSTTGNLSFEDKYDIYVGPQDERALKNFWDGAEKIVSYGTFDIISKVLHSLLNVAHAITRNWGVAIILVTILVYILLFPLSLKSMLSMKKMQTLQPKIEELRTKFKDNPQKLNQEIMEMYKREKANPFGGCLPMLLQIPVFFALYQLLMRLISLKGASFLWIKDLSEPDRLMVFQSNLPIIGRELNILPLLMAGVMFLQQKFTPQTAATKEAAEQQKIMAFVMPIIFGVLFYKMSSGLVLYWFVNSLLMFGFQWKIAKIKT